MIDLLPRTNELIRQTEFATKRVAANVGTMVIVSAIEPAPSLELIDHYIVAAENLPASVLIVINKTDLHGSHRVIDTIRSKYKNLPYPILETSVTAASGLDALTRQLKNHAYVFVGQSGVGKSTLINYLIPTINIDTQSISAGIQQGRHTTSVTTLYDLPECGELIDSPGVRDFSLPKLDKEKILTGFRDIASLGDQCKYHDCAHIREPDCAVKYAMQNGKLDDKRYASYKKMMAQLA